MICDKVVCRPMAEPYIIKKIENYKIAVISIISPEVFLFFPKDKIKNSKVLNYLPNLREKYKIFKEKGRLNSCPFSYESLF